MLLAGIGVTAFDGASEGPLFNDLLPRLQDFFGGLGLGPEKALELGFTTGLLASVLVVSLIWVLARPGRELAHSLAPILAAYVVAHYFSLLAYNGQDLARLASDPLGDGSDLFGTADAGIDYGIVSADAIWYVQVAALVVGHVAALVLAHDRALVVRGSHRAGDALPDRHAGPDGLLHLPRPLAALGGERMSGPPLAHAGHWLAQIAYLAPLVLLVGLLVWGKLRERRERRRNAGVTDA